jgi:NNP family nitrate/nitrite transporter-like MFS transporter
VFNAFRFWFLLTFSAIIPGNMGGGATFAIMTSLFQALRDKYGLSTHVAWRAAFAIVP